jgi:CYTH domain-containing protein
VQRIEIEEPTSEEVFDRLWPLTKDCRIHKRRYRVPEGDLMWEIDEFLDRDLHLAEVELESASQNPKLPRWLAPHVVREVTDDPRYTNLALAEQGESAPRED